jgi:hypothetical protein
MPGSPLRGFASDLPARPRRSEQQLVYYRNEVQELEYQAVCPRADAGGGVKPGCKTQQRGSCIRNEPIVVLCLPPAPLISEQMPLQPKTVTFC